MTRRDPPDATRLARLEELFDAAVALPRDRRDAFLRSACGDDPSLSREVTELIAAETTAPRLLSALDETCAPLDAAPAEDLVGTEIGPYRVDAYVASGGMADVYRATVREPSASEAGSVAIKVLRRGLDTDALLRRFRRERRTLARLRHPRIVSLVAAGALDDGRPWLATEFVAGEPIDHYCDSRGVDLTTRVELLLRACSAVEYAHRNLIVHRDLKPSNLLVTDEGEPKLLDFGVARLLAPDEDDGDLTDPSQPAPLTPAWASPEQLSGEPATTASDVYALGLLLSVLRRDGANDRSRFRDDLASIERVACDPDPARRYGSVERFADDLARARDGLPLRAHPNLLGDRLRRFVARHRWAVIGAAGLALGAVVGAAGLYSGWRHARSEATLGWRAHREAVDVAALLQELVKTSSGGSLESALDSVASRLSEYADQPETEGRTRIVLGSLYLEIGRLVDARRHLERGLELARSHRGFDARTIREAEERLRRLVDGDADAGR